MKLFCAEKKAFLKKSIVFNFLQIEKLTSQINVD